MSLIKEAGRTALLTALLPTGILGLAGLLATPAMAAAPTDPRLPALVRTPFSANGQTLFADISEDVAGNAVAGLLEVPAGTAAYLSIQQCTLNETGCVNVPGSIRSYPAGSTNTRPVTGSVTPAKGSTYRTCAIVNVGGTTGGGCSNWVFQGGQAFLSTVSLVRQSGGITSRIDTRSLNGQMESLQLDTWICNGAGANCSVVAQRTITSYLPPYAYAWTSTAPSVPASFGHTYKACAIMSVQGAIAGACTPLVVV
jgi:hypothetical protein